MSFQPISFARIISGIADYDKEATQPDSVAFIRHFDYRTNPRRWTLLPKAQKESGSVITGLPKWGERIDDTTYVYDGGGSFYTRSLAGAVALVHSAANAHGNGLRFFGEDDFMYYTTDKAIGRYGRISGTPVWVDDFLGAQGGVPTNTYSLDLEASSSRYATAADSASLSQTGDITLETWRKPESLPTVGTEVVLMSKWNEASDQRSYKWTVYAISGYFGDGSDGALTISANTTEAPIDSTAAGTSGAYTLSATNGSFAAEQIIMIHQTRGTGAGTWQRNRIVGYVAGTITLEVPLNFSYNSTGANKAQVRVLKQYSAVTVNSGITYTAKAWDGTVGGIIAMLCSGTITVTGKILAQGKGFRGGAAVENGNAGKQGEGTAGAGDTVSNAANGNGGGGGELDGLNAAGAGGGTNSQTDAENGETVGNADGGIKGDSVGSADLTTMVFGGGAGSGAAGSGGISKDGGAGGGIIFLAADTITLTGTDALDNDGASPVVTISGLTLYDDFGTGSVDATKWATGGTVTIRSGKLSLRGNNGTSSENSTATTNDKTAVSPPGEPIDTAVQFYMEHEGGTHGGGGTCRVRLTNGTDYIEIAVLMDVNDFIIRLGGTYGSGDGERWDGADGTILIEEDGADIKIYHNNDLKQTISGKQIQANSRLDAACETGSPGSTNHYLNVDNVYVDASTALAPSGGSAAGGGGSTLLKAGTLTLGTLLAVAASAAGDDGLGATGGDGGNGGVGRIHVDYLTSVSGTTTPTLDSAQDNSLSAVEYQSRLYISSTGANSETYKQNLSTIALATWGHLAVSWDASASLATFYEGGGNIGTATGALTAIFNSTALFAIGASFSGAGAAEKFWDGLVEENRLWNTVRSDNEIATNKDRQLLGTEPTLVAYYKHNNALDDDSPQANTLTLVNSPVYSTDVPFAGATTRLDIDQQDANTGDTYALPTAISESATERQTFVPAKDPQKSISVFVAAKGTGAWTLTVHDAQNRTIATKTIANANLPASGEIEFIFDTPWRSIIGATYHFHLITTVADGTIVSDTNNDMETAQFFSYYQFLVTDTDFHPIDQITNLLAIGNERYVATWDGGTYNPHRLTFSSGWKVRCIAKWREYHAYGCVRGDDIADYDQGIIFFWDGISDTYNFFIDVPEGGINAMVGSQGTLYIVAGYQSQLLEYTGGDKAEKSKTIARNLGVGEQVEVLPGAMALWQTLLRIGMGVTDSDTIEQGVYTWGKKNKNYPDSLSFDYAISTLNTQNSGVSVGMVLPVEKELLIGWGDNGSYGLDSVDPASTSFAEGSIEFLIRDEGGVWKEKQVVEVKADFEALVAGDTVGIQYKLDRSNVWSNEVTGTVAGIKVLYSELSNARHREYQLRLNARTTNTTSPAILGLTIDENMLEDEQQL